MIFEALYFTLDLALLEADRTKMLTVKGDIAQGTQKSPAGRARYNRLFAGMIKAAGFLVHPQRRTSLAHREQSVDSRERIDPLENMAGIAGLQRLGIDSRLSQWSVAVGTAEHDTSYPEL